MRVADENLDHGLAVGRIPRGGQRPATHLGPLGLGQGELPGDPQVAFHRPPAIRAGLVGRREVEQHGSRIGRHPLAEHPRGSVLQRGIARPRRRCDRRERYATTHVGERLHEHAGPRSGRPDRLRDPGRAGVAVGHPHRGLLERRRGRRPLDVIPRVGRLRNEHSEIFQFDDRAKRRHGSGADRRIVMLHEWEYRACRRRDPAITYETDHQRQRPRVAAGEPRHDHLVDAVGRHGRDRLADRRKHGRPGSGRDLQQPRRG